MLLFQKLITETQMSKPPEPAMDHDSIKSMILLPFIAVYFRSYRYETPCSAGIWGLQHLYFLNFATCNPQPHRCHNLICELYHELWSRKFLIGLQVHFDALNVALFLKLSLNMWF